ncbi:sialate O-acetylesterase [Roseiconus nitratireducens]|uniref:Sialate O-acetylesterase n=1 Tax=Roseiconus nitratireducens TaxID=2605748 RepID=A0A5M6DIX8_9BACT|nr:sialate O-acetylesterase [Roseiconus nitratireducens]KAA5546159.1 sialate O-acetylesterase [Roseiconus nitratireducens]
MRKRALLPSLVVMLLMASGFFSDRAAAQELPFVHPLFSDHMVLQRDLKTPVWGWAHPGQKVTVSVADRSGTAEADSSGRWMAWLEPLPAGGPHELTVTGPQSVTISDVLVGDVWICSGQSNMEWPLAAANDAQQEIAAAHHPKLRLFSVPKRISAEPQQTVAARWTTCTPETARGFSAVGYFFGRDLQRELEVPIGLVHASWGGTVAEAWTSAGSLRTMDDFAPVVESFQQQAAAKRSGENGFEAMMERWWKDNDPGTRENWQDGADESEEWSSMELPGNWEDRGLSNYDGVVWFQKEFSVPEQAAGKPAVVHLGPIDDRDTTWVNGHRVGGQAEWMRGRDYQIPAEYLKAGRNVISIRVLDTGGGGGLYGNPDQMSVQVEGQTSIPLAGAWKYQATTPLAKAKPTPQPLNSNPNVVTVLYNGMIAPLEPLAVKGAIWYQGESNAGRPVQYRTLLPTLIGDWREKFTSDQFTFLIVELANFMAVQTQPVESGWAMLREAQQMTAKNDPHAGIASAIDIGEANDIHPRNKQEVGRRLALSALKIAYDRDLVSRGPEFVSATFDPGQATLRFEHVGEGLMAKGGELKGFAIAGDDKQFVWGNAKIEGDTVVVSAPEVKQPTAVRYSWANNPIGTLYNRAGLPASPFRTDED